MSNKDMPAKGIEPITCPTCGGDKKCRTCWGAKLIPDPNPPQKASGGGGKVACPECHASGQCSSCNGTGKIG